MCFVSSSSKRCLNLQPPGWGEEQQSPILHRVTAPWAVLICFFGLDPKRTRALILAPMTHLNLVGTGETPWKKPCPFSSTKLSKSRSKDPSLAQSSALGGHAEELRGPDWAAVTSCRVLPCPSGHAAPCSAGGDAVLPGASSCQDWQGGHFPHCLSCLWFAWAAIWL